MTDPIPLKKPITAHGEQVNSLTLRPPVTKDVIELGYPTLIVMTGDEPAVEIRAKVVAKYISRLASIPMGAVESLDIGDHQVLTGVVMGFFGQDAGGSASSPSTD